MQIVERADQQIMKADRGRTLRGADRADPRAFSIFSARWDVASLTK